MIRLILTVARAMLLVLAWLAVVAGAAWASGALWYDFPVVSLRRAAAIALDVAFLAAFVMLRPMWVKMAGIGGLVALVAAWWFTQQPRNDREWQPDVAQTPWAEINGDVVTLHNVRNCDYRSATDFTPRWETRTVRLSQITGIDLLINYWGSRWMAHPIASFQFADAPPVAFSIETRKEVGEKYSAIGGIYRQYELIYIAADERDVIRLRTNFRKGEDAYLYRTKVTPERARERFLEYLATMNNLRVQPRWYNAITTNCTTAIRAQHPASKRLPWDWRILVNGKADEMLYERNAILTADLPFAELRRRALVNEAAHVAAKAPDFSRLIRHGRPGFGR